MTSDGNTALGPGVTLGVDGTKVGVGLEAPRGMWRCCVGVHVSHLECGGQQFIVCRNPFLWKSVFVFFGSFPFLPQERMWRRKRGVQHSEDECD